MGRLLTVLCALALMFWCPPVHAEEDTSEEAATEESNAAEDASEDSHTEEDAGEENTKDEPVYELDPIPVTFLDTIKVVGSIIDSRETPGSVHRLSAAQIKEQNVAFDDINRMLFRIPGINVQEEDGYGLRPNIGMRGTAVDRSAGITLMEDAVLMAPAPYSAPAAYYFPIAGRMSGIEVRKGSSQIQYGPRTNGGALNMISTPTPRRLSGEARISAGQDETGKLYANVGAGSKYASFLLETYQIQTNGFKELDTGGNTGFDIEDYVGKVVFNTSPTASVFHRLTLKVGRTDELANETYVGLTDADFEDAPYRRYAGSQRDVMTSDHQQYMVRYLLLAGPASVTTTVYRNQFHRNWFKLDTVGGTSIRDILEDPQTYQQEYRYLVGFDTSPDDALSVKANNRTYDSKGVESVLKTSFDALGAHHELDFGARFHGDEEDRFQHSDGFRMEEGGEMVITSKGIPGFAGGGNNRVNSAKAFAAFAIEHMSAGPLVLTPGVRFEHIEGKREQYGAGDPDRTSDPAVTENTTDVVLPGMGAHFRAGGGVSLFGGVHRGFSPPRPGAGVKTKPELSVNYEAGSRIERRRFHAQLVGFFNDYSNLHGRDTFSSGGTGSGDLFNAGEVNSYGLETSFGFELLDHSRWGLGVPLALTYTWTVAEFQNSFSSSFDPWGNVTAGDRLPYVPEHQASASIALEFDHFRLGTLASYVSRTPTEALQGPIPDNRSVDARLILDATAEVNFASYYAAFVSIQNITDETYIVARRPAGVRPGLPRRLVAGLRLGF